MSLQLWLAFVAASAVVLVIPGPTVMLVVSYALGRGRATGWATVPGVTLGDIAAMTTSLIGAGALLAASAALFTVLKFAGAAYLIWLGAKLWRERPALPDSEPETSARPANASAQAMFWHAFTVTALNPKSIVFFVAFVPQFVDPSGGLAQFAILEATFLALAALNVGLWALLAGELGARIRRPGTLRLLNRAGGSVLIGAGILTAFARR